MALVQVPLSTSTQSRPQVLVQDFHHQPRVKPASSIHSYFTPRHPPPDISLACHASLSPAISGKRSRQQLATHAKLPPTQRLIIDIIKSPVILLDFHRTRSSTCHDPAASISIRLGQLFLTQMEPEGCPLCLRIMLDPTRTPCRHFFCHACLYRYLETSNACPLCSAILYQRVTTTNMPMLQPQSSPASTSRLPQYMLPGASFGNLTIAPPPPPPPASTTDAPSTTDTRSQESNRYRLHQTPRSPPREWLFQHNIPSPSPRDATRQAPEAAIRTSIPSVTM